MKLGLLAGSIALIFTLQGCSKPEATAVQENSQANAVA